MKNLQAHKQDVQWNYRKFQMMKTKVMWQKVAGNEPEVAGRSETCCEEPVCQAKGFDFVLKAMRNYWRILSREVT